jgi:hypothetical protein
MLALLSETRNRTVRSVTVRTVRPFIMPASAPVAIVLSRLLHAAEPHVRLLSESLRLAREHSSTAVMDADFAKDVEAAVESHREPLNPPAWD